MLHWLLAPGELLAGGEGSLSASISPSDSHSAPLTVTCEARLMCTDKVLATCTAQVAQPAKVKANNGESLFASVICINTAKVGSAPAGWVETDLKKKTNKKRF